MSLVADPVAAADKVTTRRQAARLFQDLDVELALNDDVTPEWENKAHKALKELTAKWGDGLWEHDAGNSPQGENHIPKMSRGAQKGLDREHAAAGHPATHKPEQRGTPPAKKTAAKKAAAAQKGKAPAGRASRRGGASPGRGRGTAGRAWKQTGVPGATASASQLALQVAGVTIGLSITYALLRNSVKASPGHSATELLSGGIGTAIDLVIRPVDPVTALASGNPSQAIADSKAGKTTAGKPGGTKTTAGADAGAAAGQIAGIFLPKRAGAGRARRRPPTRPLIHPNP